MQRNAMERRLRAATCGLLWLVGWAWAVSAAAIVASHWGR